jgi:hypothetical protein
MQKKALLTSSNPLIGGAARPEWYDIKLIAWELSVSPNTIKSWLSEGRIPPPDIRGHRFNRWRRETISLFLADPLAWRTKKTE